MKTGKTIVRVLAVILLLSMLVGFTPAIPAAAVDDTGAVVLADPVDEGNEGTEVSPEPSVTPSAEPSVEPVKKVAVTFDGNVTVTADDTALESGAEVEVGTELAITVKAKNVASAILVNGAKNEETYTIAEKDEAVDISAFGIVSVTVTKENQWTRAETNTKSVVVEVFGKDVTVNGQTVKNNKIEFEQTAAASESGREFKVTAACSGVTVETAVTVKKIDTKAPSAKMAKDPEVLMVEKERYIGHGEWEKYDAESDFSKYSIIVSDAGGSSIASITAEGYYVSDITGEVVAINGKDYNKTIQFEEGKSEYEFEAKHTYYLGWSHSVFYKITVKDAAGNETVFYSNDPDSGNWITSIDKDPPEIVSMNAKVGRNEFILDNVYGEEEKEIIGTVKDKDKVYVLGPNSTFTITAADRSYVKKIVVDGVAVTAPSYTSPFEAVFTKEQFEQMEKSNQNKQFYAEDCAKPYEDSEEGNTTNKSDTVKMIYDDQAPVLKNVMFATKDQTSFEKIAHAVSGGLMFHETVQVSFNQENEGNTNIYSYYYQFVSADGQTSAWYALHVAGNERSIIQEDDLVTLMLKVPEEFRNGEISEFTVSVFAEDEAGNVSLTDDNQAQSATLEEGKDVATHDATYTSDDANMVAFVYTPTNGDEQVPYRGEWVKEVAFDVRADLSSYYGKYYQKNINDADMPQPKNENDTLEIVTDVNPEISVVVDKEKVLEDGATLPILKDSSLDSNSKIWEGTYTYGVLEDGKVASGDGTATFTMVVNVNKSIYVAELVIEESHQDEAGNTIIDKSHLAWNLSSSETDKAKLNVVVNNLNVQNYIDQATVPAWAHENKDNAVSFNLEDGNTYGWYNDLDKFLDDVSVIAPESKMSFTTTYSVKFLKNQNFKDQAAQDKAWASVEPIAEGELTVAKDDKVLFDRENIFKEEGLYLITISTKDGLGNVPSPEEESFVIKYDVKAPEITANFTEKHTADDTFYDIQRTGTITVTDLAFTGDLSEIERFTVKADPEVGSPAEKGEWKYDEANQKWSIVYTYGVKSGNAAKDGDNYKLSVDVVDNAGNKSSTTTDGILTKNGKNTDTKVYYTGDNATGFTVDQTVPVVSVSFNNNNVRNGKYFNAARTATITVVEHNFDPARVTLTATGASAGATASEGWSQNGDTWTKTVTFARDANCKFSIDVVDKAGNVCPNANVKYSGVATADFVIDLTRPNVQYTGVDASPYAEACTPGFTATDTNLGNEFTYKLTRKTMKGEQDVTNLLNHAGTAARFSYSDIPNSRDDDGIYTFTCSVTDLAGNVTTLNPVEFAVNRHGSVYLLNKELQNVVGKYFNEDGWAKVDDGNLVITEYNPTPLKDDAKLELYRDGTRVETYTGDALKKLVSGGDRGGLGLYEYAYKLPAADFAEDGSYRVVLSSTDANDHKSGNDKTGAEINFVIDTVSPEIVSISGLEKRTVNAEEQPVGFHILDTYGLDSVAIRTAGPDGAIVKEYISQAKYDAQNGKLEPYQQLLPEGELDLTDEIILIQNNTPYHVVISVTDKAGNTTVADGGSIVSSTEAEAMTPAYDFQDSVTVSTNFFVRYIHNTGALVGTGVGAVAIAGLWLVLAKRRKDDEEKKTA